jgi:hypothetical protein
MVDKAFRIELNISRVAVLKKTSHSLISKLSKICNKNILLLGSIELTIEAFGN